jgi:hypothetical protein
MKLLRPIAGGLARLPRLGHLALILLTPLGIAMAQIAAGQAMMVGADGAIHLDQGQSVNANSPVIIQQTPELIQPGMQMMPQPGMMQSGMMPGVMQPGMMPGMPMMSQSLSATPYGSCVPFVPCSPVVTETVQQQQQQLPIAFSIFGEFLYLRPHTDIVHAQQVTALGAPFGDLGVNDFDYEPGVRVGGDIAVGPSNSLAASGTWFESDASSTLEAPGIVGGAVVSLVQIPAAGILASSGPVSSTSELNFYTAEAEYRSRLLQGPRHWVNGGLGLRYAHLEQQFNQSGTFLGAPGGVITTGSDIEFDGGGPRLTLDGGRLMGNRGFSIFARSSVSPLTGRFHATYNLRNETTDDQLALVNYEDDRIMTLFDYEVGLAWTGPRKRWRFAAGYTQSYWFNAVTTEEFISAVQANDYTDISDTLMFDGLTARVEHLW